MINHENVIFSHIEKISEIEALAKSNTKRIDNMEKIIEAVYEMNGNIKVIAEQFKQQQAELTKVVECIDNHETRITISENSGNRRDSQIFRQILWLLTVLIITVCFYTLLHYINSGGEWIW